MVGESVSTRRREPPETADLNVAVTAKRNNATLPVRDATVTATTSGNEPNTERTDATGMARFMRLPRGVVTVVVAAPGVATNASQVELDETELTHPVSLRWPLGQLKITVVSTNQSGTLPIADCRVKIDLEGDDPRSLPKTDESGVAIAAGLPFGKMTITTIATGWETAKEVYHLEKSEAELKIVLSKQRRPLGE